LATVAKSAEFFSIGTGGPTGVYFQVGNAVCKMVAKIQSPEHGRKKVLIKLIVVQHHQQGSTYNIGQIMEGELQFGVAQSDWQYHASMVLSQAGGVSETIRWFGEQYFLLIQSHSIFCS
jgi:TRAP-type uncharacterized transport system substrate-binding protein